MKSMNFSFKRPEDSPGFLLWQISNHWQRQQRQALAKLGLTHAQFVVLACTLWLSTTTKEDVTQQQVSELAKIDKMSMSDLVATLTKKKLLRRLPHKKDKRAFSLTLTSNGHILVLKAIPIVEGIDAKFFTKETTNLAQLVQHLRHLL